MTPRAKPFLGDDTRPDVKSVMAVSEKLQLLSSLQLLPVFWQDQERVRCHRVQRHILWKSTGWYVEIHSGLGWTSEVMTDWAKRNSSDLMPFSHKIRQRSMIWGTAHLCRPGLSSVLKQNKEEHWEEQLQCRNDLPLFSGALLGAPDDLVTKTTRGLRTCRGHFEHHCYSNRWSDQFVS